MRCRKCILTENYPGISFDQEGVCNYCKKNKNFVSQANETIITENMLVQRLRGYIQSQNKYDVLVPLSGGVDSSYTLIKLVRAYGLRPLVYHSDNGFEEKTATENVKKLCKRLNVDLLILQQDMVFMKKLWKYFNEAKVKELSTCYVCGNILYLNALEIAYRYNIPLIVNGYSKGQAELSSNRECGRQKLEKIFDIVEKWGDAEFYREFIRKYEYLNCQKTVQSYEDIDSSRDKDKILVVPFYLFKNYITNKEELRKTCEDFFDWMPLENSYPKRSTNCKMVWLNTYCDIKKNGYSVYDTEYASLVRENEMEREQALDDLEFQPSMDLIQELADEIDLDLNRVGVQQRKDASTINIEFEF